MPEFAKLSTQALQRILHEQTVIVAYAPERAEITLADLLPNEKQRQRAAQIIRGLISDEEMDERFIEALSALAKRLDLPGDGTAKPRTTPRRGAPAQAH